MGVAKAPEPLTDSHLLVEFDCGNEALNDWLKKHALKNQDSGASRTFVISEGKRVVGFYALASGSVERISAPAAIARNMPEAVPVMVLGRLAVERAIQGQGLGAALVERCLVTHTGCCTECRRSGGAGTRYFRRCQAFLPEIRFPRIAY